MSRLYSFLMPLLFTVSAASAQDDLVRLPGQGEIKRKAAAQFLEAERLIPGGGLLLSFDSDSDGLVSNDELMDGIDEAFLTADSNGDGFLTPLEQISWSESLPTRDASLSNPARFDPNLDRRVNAEEFSAVIVSFAEDVADEESGQIVIASLKTTRREVAARNAEEIRQRQRPDGAGQRRPQRRGS